MNDFFHFYFVFTLHITGDFDSIEMTDRANCLPATTAMVCTSGSTIGSVTAVQSNGDICNKLGLDLNNFETISKNTKVDPIIIANQIYKTPQMNNKSILASNAIEIHSVITYILIYFITKSTPLIVITIIINTMLIICATIPGFN